MSATASLLAYARKRDRFFAQLIDRLRGDDRVVAAWLSGPHGRDEEDEWSDYDLHVAVNDGVLPDILNSPERLLKLAGKVLLVQANFPSDSMPGGRFWLVVYEGPVEIDWNIGPASLAARPGASRLLFERTVVPYAAGSPLQPADELVREAQGAVEFFWAMTPIAIKYAGRGWIGKAVQLTGLLSLAAIRLWRWRATKQR